MGGGSVFDSIQKEIGCVYPAPRDCETTQRTLSLTILYSDRVFATHGERDCFSFTHIHNCVPLCPYSQFVRIVRVDFLEDQRPSCQTAINHFACLATLELGANNWRDAPLVARAEQKELERIRSGQGENEGGIENARTFDGHLANYAGEPSNASSSSYS